MTFPLRLMMIADVGGGARRHIGDEAMLEANLEALRRLIPGLRVTVVSHHPGWTAARYAVDSVAPFGFPSGPSAAGARAMLLNQLLAEAESLSRHPTTAALAAADAFVMSGGGNLASTWADLLYERVALLQLARRLGKPSIVLGQTLGPRLTDADGPVLAEALATARFLGVRELPSAAFAYAIGIPAERLHYQGDDALTLDELADDPPEGRAPTIALTLDPQLRAINESAFGALVTQVDALLRATAASLVLVPHAFGDESGPSDLNEARLFAERLGRPDTSIEEGLDACAARGVAVRASMVISSRYHPIVFALSGGVPALGIYGDEYGRIKLQGALMHGGLERWAVTYEEVAAGALLPNALELWARRDAIRRDLAIARDRWREESQERWSAVLRALDPSANLAAAGPVFEQPSAELMRRILSTLELHRRGWEWQRAIAEETSVALDEARYLRRKAESGLGLLSSLRRWGGALLRAARLRR